MKNQWLVVLGLGAGIALSGCSSPASTQSQDQLLVNKIDELSSQVQSLTNQVNDMKSEHSQMSSDVSSTKMMVKESYDEATRANKRIDRIATSYTK
ncbi:Lpp/OprI family alanine-zipper lipoprotein [Vibrio sp. Of7-15]|uniref:Lpp/OprI family alanine-zipper lipoprotein n=1 Tax=Vibrio sp. Of7-15 TaxID=2724879 RepID=UPI001EF3C4A7|nr:Lpp/OprI family alanine-zipper lipoprotein [Vibrio sp. Of7-15]MCG7495583.1 Lpp/OprI family alanine-zipper lipoprotein [Vibrio sp. Of7-15]